MVMPTRSEIKAGLKTGRFSLADNEFSWDLDIGSTGPSNVNAFQLADGLEYKLQPQCTVIFYAEVSDPIRIQTTTQYEQVEEAQVPDVGNMLQRVLVKIPCFFPSQ